MGQGLGQELGTTARIQGKVSTEITAEVEAEACQGLELGSGGVEWNNAGNLTGARIQKQR